MPALWRWRCSFVPLFMPSIHPIHPRRTTNPRGVSISSAIRCRRAQWRGWERCGCATRLAWRFPPMAKSWPRPNAIPSTCGMRLAASSCGVWRCQVPHDGPTRSSFHRMDERSPSWTISESISRSGEWTRKLLCLPHTSRGGRALFNWWGHESFSLRTTRHFTLATIGRSTVGTRRPARRLIGSNTGRNTTGTPIQSSSPAMANASPRPATRNPWSGCGIPIRENSLTSSNPVTLSTEKACEAWRSAQMAVYWPPAALTGRCVCGT